MKFLKFLQPIRQWRRMSDAQKILSSKSGWHISPPPHYLQAEAAATLAFATNDSIIAAMQGGNPYALKNVLDCMCGYDIKKPITESDAELLLLELFMSLRPTDVSTPYVIKVTLESIRHIMESGHLRWVKPLQEQICQLAQESLARWHFVERPGRPDGSEKQRIRDEDQYLESWREILTWFAQDFSRFPQLRDLNAVSTS